MPNELSDLYEDPDAGTEISDLDTNDLILIGQSALRLYRHYAQHNELSNELMEDLENRLSEMGLLDEDEE